MADRCYQTPHCKEKILESANDMQDVSLEYGRFRFRLRAACEAVLPPFKGSALRGVLGRALYKIACHSPRNTCEGCMFLTRCAYAYIFDTNPHTVSGEIGQRYVPHPYIIEPFLDGRESYAPGDILSFNLVLLGQSLDYLPYVIMAFQEVEKIGLGAGRYPFILESVEQDLGGSSETIWRGGKSFLQSPKREDLSCYLRPGSRVSGEKVKLELETPMRLVFGGEMVTALMFPVLMRALFRRIGFLARAHGKAPLELPFQELLQKAESIKTVEPELSWQEWERYSARQRKKLQMGGLVGSACFKGKLQEFLPFLRMGEIVHVGKGTVFGLGKIRIIED
ncbi:CRISPR system precrRNA processing endoribonuclease RAMP protein Cas6 [Dethiobacter alkaliphilus]|uniref:CRISPR system precrRNA processing endoribonuclease RAMP protein Cas6 n=1 Tax=Dethiobacter alkaliphilus TaxID=427926 RepID=UPI002225BA8C|nr:CRISPR system precrRNA processing endoribonuclease RAMP protein Cas6 [Dethiobacter alkaliphilus]MCW3488680.1 CRISPR system precrRNA processing endoribonuclease RAMP protein Cas6 [Dethiobacter alkaliphilus]